MDTIRDSLGLGAREVISIDRCRTEFIELLDSRSAVDSLLRQNTSAARDLKSPLESAFHRVLKLAESIRGDYNHRLDADPAVRETSQSLVASLLEAFIALEQKIEGTSVKASEMCDRVGIRSPNNPWFRA
jgi:hypothetical protein